MKSLFRAETSLIPYRLRIPGGAEIVSDARVLDEQADVVAASRKLEIADNFAVGSDIQSGSRTETYTSGMALEKTGRIASVGAGWRLSESQA